MCCSRLPKAINVPVRPTPALVTKKDLVCQQNRLSVLGKELVVIELDPHTSTKRRV